MRCDVARRAKRPAEGLPACDRALAAAPDEIDYRLTRATTLEDLGRDDDALRDLSVAIERGPQRTDVLARRAYHLLRTKRYEEATRELVLLRQLDPVEPRSMRSSERLITSLIYDGHQARVAGDMARAVQLFTLALQLDPGHSDARKRLAEAQGRQQTAQGSAGELAALEARLASSPDDLQLRRQLDALYLRAGQLPAIVKMWTTFLATHPDHAEALFERSGTYYHLKDMEHAKADARRACALGLTAACQVVKRFGG